MGKPRNNPVTKATKDLDMTQAIKLRMDGLSYGKIAQIIGCDKSNVLRRLKPFFGNQLDVPAFKTHRADLFAGQQLRVLNAITDADIKKASLRDKVIAAATLYDKERIERGQGNSQNSVIFNLVFNSPDLPKGVIEVKTPANNLSNNAENSYLPNDNE